MAVASKFNVYAPGSRGPLEVSEDGTTWYRLPKIRNVGFASTAPSESTIEYTDEPTETRSGQSGPGNATYDLTRAPTIMGYRICAAAFESGAEVRFRDWGGQPVVEAVTPGTLAVTTGGVGTLVNENAGSAVAPAKRYQPGRVVIPTAAALNAQALVIEGVTGSTGLVLTRLGTITTVAAAGQPALVTPDMEDITAVVAATFSVVSPGTFREFNGRVTTMGAYTRGPGNEGQVDQLVVNVLDFPSDQLVILPATA